MALRNKEGMTWAEWRRAAGVSKRRGSSVRMYGKPSSLAAAHSRLDRMVESWRRGESPAKWRAKQNPLENPVTLSPWLIAAGVAGVGAVAYIVGKSSGATKATQQIQAANPTPVALPGQKLVIITAAQTGQTIPVTTGDQFEIQLPVAVAPLAWNISITNLGGVGDIRSGVVDRSNPLLEGHVYQTVAPGTATIDASLSAAGGQPTKAFSFTVVTTDKA